MLREAMTTTCLFTGVSLPQHTKEEHTIPRSMGGRIRSRTVSSSEFNNECGSFCDDAMRLPYASMLNSLGPLLPRESQPGMLRVAASDAPPGLVLERGGRLTRQRNQVLERDKSGRPKVLLGKNEDSLRRLVKSAGLSDRAEIRHVPPTKEGVVTAQLSGLSDLIELAALKSLLLSFDHLLSDRAAPFTRSGHLEPVRAAVRDSIEHKQVSGDLLSKYSLGIQVDRLSDYKTLRQQMDVEQTPFEHFMLVAANRKTRCIDGVWVVFGFEPYGFRLCNCYDASDFCIGFVNPILRDFSPTGVIELGPKEALCNPTNLRSFTPCDSPEDGQAAARDSILNFNKRVLPLRATACDQALYHVHSRPEGDDWLVDQLRSLHFKKRLDCMRDLISLRLQNLFKHRNVPDAEITRIIDCRLANRKSLRERQTISELESCSLWPNWLQVFREVLDDLVEKYGLPDSGFWRAEYIGRDAWCELDGKAH